jgi:hypothetical protein
MPKKKGSLLGAWAFLIGLIIAVVFGFITIEGTWIVWILLILGIIVGLLNVTEKEVRPFLFAGTILVIISALSGNVFATVPYLGAIFSNILTLFVPATVIVALKSVFTLAKK